MNVGQAKAAARDWVEREAAPLPGFQGAFMTGSAIWSADDAPLAPSSDIDVMVVLQEPIPPIKLGKVAYRGVLLDVTYLEAGQLDSADDVLGSYYLASSFARPSTLLDPTGRLQALSETVSKDFHKRRWIERRCRHGWSNAARHFGALSASLPLPDQVLIWLFGTAASTIVLLCAGLRNPTVRTRYLAVRRLLADYGRQGVYDALLEHLGCASMSRTTVEQHLAALETTFDVAASVGTTPFFFSSDISAVARPISIGGSRDLIQQGYHREAIFWIVATYARCLKILDADGSPAQRQQHEPSLRALMADLGIRSFADLEHRVGIVQAEMPRVSQNAEAIMAANPAIVD